MKTDLVVVIITPELIVIQTAYKGDDPDVLMWVNILKSWEGV